MSSEVPPFCSLSESNWLCSSFEVEEEGFDPDGDVGARSWC